MATAPLSAVPVPAVPALAAPAPEVTASAPQKRVDRLCPNCDSVMERYLAEDVMFVCGACKQEQVGAPADRLLAQEGGASVSYYHNLIRTAPFDKTCYRIKEDCPECGCDFVNVVRLSSSEEVVMVCPSGHLRRGKEGPVAQ